MSFPLNYNQAMNQLASLAEPSNPSYVRVQALKTIVRELSPSNPSQRANHLALELEPHPEPSPQASAEAEPAALPEGGRQPFTLVSEEDLPEEDDEYQ